MINRTTLLATPNTDINFTQSDQVCSIYNFVPHLSSSLQMYAWLKTINTQHSRSVDHRLR